MIHARPTFFSWLFDTTTVHPALHSLISLDVGMGGDGRNLMAGQLHHRFICIIANNFRSPPRRRSSHILSLYTCTTVLVTQSATVCREGVPKALSRQQWLIRSFLRSEIKGSFHLIDELHSTLKILVGANTVVLYPVAHREKATIVLSK